MKYLLLLLVFACPLFVQAQVSSSDSSLIRQACENYVGGFYNSDTIRIAQGVHPELVKRIIAKKMNYQIRNMSAQELINTAKGFKHPSDSGEPFKITVNIYDIANDIAMAKITTNKMNFFDYAQLAKINGNWKIINVLWAFNP